MTECRALSSSDEEESFYDDARQYLDGDDGVTDIYLNVRVLPRVTVQHHEQQQLQPTCSTDRETVRKNRGRSLRSAISRAVALGKQLAGRSKIDSARFDGYLQDFADCDLGTPWIVNALTQELESREHIAGLYRTSSDFHETRKLKKKFKRGAFPKLHKFDSHVLANTLMSFLADLREPVIPQENWEAFVGNGQLMPLDKRVYFLESLIHTLPPANRRTLGVLLMHLQTLIAREPEKKMQHFLKLAEAFAPLVVGHSCSEGKTDPVEIDKIFQTMVGLMHINGEKFMV